MIGKYVISGYKLPHEVVEIMSDQTHNEWGFRYGSMHIIGSNGCARWVQFGLYNYQHVSKLADLA